MGLLLPMQFTQSLYDIDQGRLIPGSWSLQLTGMHRLLILQPLRFFFHQLHLQPVLLNHFLGLLQLFLQGLDHHLLLVEHWICELVLLLVGLCLYLGHLLQNWMYELAFVPRWLERSLDWGLLYGLAWRLVWGFGWSRLLGLLSWVGLL